MSIVFSVLRNKRPRVSGCADPILPEGTRLYTDPATSPSSHLDEYLAYQTSRDSAEILRRLKTVYSGLTPIGDDVLGRRRASSSAIEQTIRRNKER